MRTIAITLAAMLAVLLALPATAAGDTRDTLRVAGRPSNAASAARVPAKPLLPRPRPRARPRGTKSGLGALVVRKDPIGAPVDPIRGRDLRSMSDRAFGDDDRDGIVCDESPIYCDTCAKFGCVWAELLNTLAHGLSAGHAYTKLTLADRIPILRETCPVPNNLGVLDAEMMAWQSCVQADPFVAQVLAAKQLPLPALLHELVELRKLVQLQEPHFGEERQNQESPTPPKQ